MYKVNGLPHYVTAHGQTLFAAQTVLASKTSSKTMLKVGGVSGSIEIVLRAHSEIKIGLGKIITVTLNQSDGAPKASTIAGKAVIADSEWDELSKIVHTEKTRTSSKPGEVTIWTVRLPPVEAKTRLKITLDGDKFKGQIGAWYDHNDGVLIPWKDFPANTTLFTDSEPYINNNGGSVNVIATVMTRDLSVTGAGVISMVLQYESTDATSHAKTWTKLKDELYRVTAPDKIPAGTVLGRFVLPSNVKSFITADLVTDDSTCEGTVDVFPTYLPR